MADWLESAYNTSQPQQTQQPTAQPGNSGSSSSQSNGSGGSSFVDIFNSITSGTSTLLDSVTGFLGSIGGKSKTDASGMPYYDDGGNSGNKTPINIDFTKVLIIAVVVIGGTAATIFLFKWMKKKKVKAA